MWWQPRDPDDELREELEYHLARRAETHGDNAARRQFGNPTQVQEELRAQRIPRWLDALWQDLHYGLRGLRRSPGYTFAVLAALTLGIGSSSAVFSVVDRLLFRPLPYAHADRLVWFGMAAPIEPDEWLLGPDFLDYRDRQTAFDSMTATRGQRPCDLTDGEAVRLTCRLADSTFLTTFGIQPAAGRGFTREEDQPDAAPVALISHALWQSRFARAPGAVGQSLEIDGKPTRIVGVLPRDFDWPMLGPTDLLVPMRLNEARERQRQNMAYLHVFGRLKPGVSVEQARQRLEPLFKDSLQHVPPQFRKEVSLRVAAFRQRQVRNTRAASLALLGAVLTVLLVACANAANLMLARAASRARESAVRAALGASRWRLIRQTLTESMLVSVAAGVAGVALAWALLRVFRAIAPAGVARLDQAQLDGRVLAFTLALCLVSALLAGLAPAVGSLKTETLTGARVAGGGVRRGCLRQSLVALQIGLSIILLAGAGLLLRSLWKLQSVDLGIQTSGVIAANVSLNAKRFPTPSHRAAFFASLEPRLRALPGVEEVALADSLPPQNRMMSMIFSMIEKQGVPLDRTKPTGGMVNVRRVTPGYFQALGVGIVRGRGFTDEDRRPASERVLVVDETLARRLFPDGDAVGQRVRPGLAGEWHTIVGVARNVRNAGLRKAPDPEYYHLWREIGSGTVHAVIRSHGLLAAPLVANMLREAEPSTPVQVETLESQVATLTAQPRFQAMLLLLFAGFALLLAAIGLAGVVSYLVAQRTNEIGVRVAFGATPGGIQRMVLGRSVRWILGGAALGIVGALAAGRAIGTLLYQVEPHDPATLVTVTALLIGVGLAASWLPARRASRLNPVEALRHD